MLSHNKAMTRNDAVNSFVPIFESGMSHQLNVIKTNDPPPAINYHAQAVAIVSTYCKCKATINIINNYNDHQATATT